MTANKTIYKCPCCDYVTHFAKALEAHQRFKKHFLKPELKVEKVVEDPVEVQEVAKEETVAEEVTVVKKTRKPRTKKTETEKE